MDQRLWPDRLAVGNRVRFDGQAYTITQLSGRQLTLVDRGGKARQVDALTLLSTHDFTVLGDEPAQVHWADGPDPGQDATGRARWWEAHIVEVLTGLPQGAVPGAPPRPMFALSVHSLAEREEAKARELAAMGIAGASARTVRRKRQRYQAHGLAGLLDGRAGRRETPGARLDPRIVEAVRDIVLSSEAGHRPGTEQVRTEVLHRLNTLIENGDIATPSRSAIRRLCTELAGASQSRRAGDRSPAVGGRVHLDVVDLPALPSGRPQTQVPLRVTFAMDAASGLVLTAVAHSARRPFAWAPALLARMCVPQDRLAEWAASHEAGGKTSADLNPFARGEPAPCVRPEILVMDSAAGPGMATLRDACGRMGIHVQAQRHLPPSAYAGVERSMARAVSLFTAYLLSPAGEAAQAAGWPQEYVQELLDTWVVRIWPHAEVPPPSRSPDEERTPLARYKAITSSAGWVSTPLPPEEFTKLLSVATRMVGPTGLRVAGRAYDAPALDPLRRARSADEGSRQQCEVRWDPYDLRRVWVRDPGGTWLTVPAVSRTDPEPAQSASVNVSPEPTASVEPAAGVSAFSPDPAELKGVIVQAGSAYRGTRHTALPLTTKAQDRPAVFPQALRLAYHSQLPVYAPDVISAVRRIEEVLLLNQGSAGVRYGVLVHGPPGTGKSTALLETACRHLDRTPGDEGEGRRPLVHVQVPPATSPRLLLVELARFLGLPLRGSPTTADLTDVVSRRMGDAGTSLVLIDEAHHLRGPGWSSAAVADVVDYLCDRVPATFVYAGLSTPGRPVDFLASVPPRRLLPVELSDVAEGDVWTDIVHRAEQELRLHRHLPGTLTALSSALHQHMGGNVGRLAFLLRAGAVRAIQDGTEELTAGLLTRQPLPGQG